MGLIARGISKSKVRRIFLFVKNFVSFLNLSASQFLRAANAIP
jgi:hypothetical protein